MKNVRFMSIIIGIVLSFCIILHADTKVPLSDRVKGTIISIGSASSDSARRAFMTPSGVVSIDVLIKTSDNKIAHVVSFYFPLPDGARALSLLNYAKENKKDVIFYEAIRKEDISSTNARRSFQFSDFEVDGMRFVER